MLLVDSYPGELPYENMNLLDFYLLTIQHSSCASVLTPSSHGKLAIYAEGDFVRDWGLSNEMKCSANKHEVCSGFLRCTDLFVHAKPSQVAKVYEAEDVYCLPRKSNGLLANKFLSEQDSRTVAAQVTGHAQASTSGRYRGCSSPAIPHLQEYQTQDEAERDLQFAGRLHSRPPADTEPFESPGDKEETTLPQPVTEVT